MADNHGCREGNLWGVWAKRMLHREHIEAGRELEDLFAAAEGAPVATMGSLIRVDGGRLNGAEHRAACTIDGRDRATKRIAEISRQLGPFFQPIVFSAVKAAMRGDVQFQWRQVVKAGSGYEGKSAGAVFFSAFEALRQALRLLSDERDALAA